MNQLPDDLHEANHETFALPRPRRRAWVFGILGASALLLVCLASAVTGLLALRHAAVALPATRTAAPPAAQAPKAPPTAQAQPGLRPLAGRIAFVDLDGRLGTVAPDGSGLRLLSGDTMQFQFPAWSPDGARLAAVGADGERGSIQVFSDRAASDPTEVYGSATRPPFYLYWSPDSSQMAFLAYDQAGMDLWLAPADASAKARTLAHGQPFYWQWAEAGDRLLIHSGGMGDDARLSFIDTHGDAVGDSLKNPGLFQAPGIAADGRYIAFAETTGDKFQVAVVDTESGKRRTAPHQGIVAMSWSPATDLLAFISPRTPRMSFTGPLRLMDAATGDIRTLVDETVLAFFWSPDGRSIAYLTTDSGFGNPQAGRPPGLAALRPVADQQIDHPPVSLKLWILDVAGGKRHLLTTFQASDIFITQFLPFFDQYALSHRVWSPSSDALVMPMVDGLGSAGIFVVPADGSEPRRVAGGTMGFWS